MKSPFIPLQSSIQSVLLSPKGNPVNTKDRSCFCLPKGSSFFSLFLPLFLSLTPSLRIQFVQSGVGVSLLVIQPSLPPAIPPCPNPFLHPDSSHREKERERERSEPVALRKILRCQPAGFKLASAPQGPLCAPPRSRRDLSWRTYL